MATLDIGALDLSSDIESEEDPFESPTKPSRKAQSASSNSKSAESSAPPRTGESKYDAEAAREANLQRELEGVRSINEVIEGVVSSLETAKGNMDTVSRTVTSASTLLNTWMRILSQTEHNQRLILNPNWKGASADVADMENELVLKAQAAERRAAEEERRREEAKRKAEDEEQRRQAGTAVRGPRGGTRGRGRGTRGSNVGGTGYVAGGSLTGSRPSSQIGRSGTGIGRGLGSQRGRARGVR